jgi:hypothetical protein
MIPLPQILAELIMALGAALLGASGLALVRPRRDPDTGEAVPQARGRILINGFIGLVVFTWGLASFLTHTGR